MKAVIIIESWFGNTAAIGQEIARELQTRRTLVNMVGVAEAPTTLPADTDLLLVGAPTHNRGLSTPSTREKASVTAKVAGDHSIGVREWLASATLPDGVKVAAFDTVTGKNFISGSAAKAASKILGRRSHGINVETRSFVVRGTAGPLADGALAEAREWGGQLAATRN